MSSPEEKTESTTYIDLTRHGNRFGGKIKGKLADGREYSFDDTKDLTPQGRQASREQGSQYPTEVALVHPRGGGEQRHAQTGDDILEGSGKIGPARSSRNLDGSPVMDKLGKGKNIKNARRGPGLDYAAIASEELFKEVSGIINKELNRLINELPPEEQEEILDPANGELRAKLREKAQVVGMKEFMKNEEAVRMAAEYEALELEHILKLSRRGVKGGETVAIPAVGSGAFAEALYKYALVVEDPETGQKKVGYNDVDEIGGFTKQATAFRIIVHRDTSQDNRRYPEKDAARSEDLTEGMEFEYAFTDPERAKLFEGKKVYLDWDVINQLAANARQRMTSKKEKNILARHTDKGSWNINAEELQARLPKDANRILGILRDLSPDSPTLAITLEGVERGWKLGEEIYKELPDNCILVVADSNQPRANLTRVLATERISQLETDEKTKRIDMVHIDGKEFSDLLLDSAPETWPPYEELIHDGVMSFPQALSLWVNEMNKLGGFPEQQLPAESAERYREAIKQIRQSITGGRNRGNNQYIPVIFMGFGHSGPLAQIRHEDNEGRETTADEMPDFAERYELSADGELLNTKRVEL